jgi:L,D-transpeptidase-like protein
MDRRKFLLGASALGLAACAKPQRDFLEPYDGVDIPLQPGVTTSLSPFVEAGPDPTTTTTTTTEPVPPMQALRNSIAAEDQPGLSFVARADAQTIDVFAEPGDSTIAWSFANPIQSGGQLVFLVDDYDGKDHYRVLLPTRPNGSFGWIRTDAVNLAFHNYAIRTDLDAFLLEVLDHDEVAFTTTIGVARANAPTPRGRYYTTEIIRPAVPDSVYGAFAYGLSGYSETFTSFNGGPGQLGIHGTNDPGTLGTNVSAGCIRMHNDNITWLVEEFKLPVGVPVEVI